MEKKRSIGVSIFAWLFIVCGALGIFGTVVNAVSPFNREFIDGFTLWWGLFGSVCYLAAGIGLLNLKPWSRQVIIALSAIYIALVPLSYQRSVVMYEKISAMQDRLLLQQLGQQEGSASPQQLEVFRQSMARAMSVSIKLGIAFGILWNAGVIFYFTRPKVKAQFALPQKPATTA